MNSEFLVNFMIIGAQKSATTSIARHLELHPDVCFCRNKEPGFFNRHADWKAHLNAYHNLYSCTDGQIAGEASTMYSFFPEFRGTPQRIFDYNPNVKLIYIMRDPVERIRSHYIHRVKRGIAVDPLPKEVLLKPGYVNRSRYGVQLRQYLAVFPRSQIMLVIFEDFIKDPVLVLDSLTQFLGIPACDFEEHLLAAPHNQSVGTFDLHPAVRYVRDCRIARKLRAAVPGRLSQRIRGWANSRPWLEQLIASEMSSAPEFPTDLRKILWHLLEDDVVAVESLLRRELPEWRNENCILGSGHSLNAASNTDCASDLTLKT